MRILIVKDAATRIPREVADRAEARAIQEQGFTVLEVGDDDVARPLASEPEQQPEPQAASAPSPAPAPAPAAKPPAVPTKRVPKPPAAPAKKAAKR